MTGASAGIGYAIANELARCGMKVIGCSRNIAKIEVKTKFMVLSLRPVDQFRCLFCRNCPKT